MENAAFSVRVFDPQRDDIFVRNLDCSYLSPGRFEVTAVAGTLTLGPDDWPKPRRENFSLDLDFPHWSRGWVAEREGRVVGLIATELEAWNRRLKIWHFYVDASTRRCGIGASLMRAALDDGRTQGAVSAWVETSNRNLPGAEVYQRLGFRLCGFDQSLYQGTRSAEEFAVFLARTL